MSSNIRIEKTCEWCGNKFIAQTTVTRFCSKRCAEHSYKARLRNEKVQQAQSVEPKSLTEVKEKDYLTVAETATLLGMTRQGVYKLIHRGELTASKLSSRLTLIKRISIEQMLDKTPYVKREFSEKKDKAITEFYTRAEIREKFGVKDWIHGFIRSWQRIMCRRRFSGERHISARHTLTGFFRRGRRIRKLRSGIRLRISSRNMA